MAEMFADEIAKAAAGNARRAAIVAGFFALMVLAILLIDLNIKKSVVKDLLAARAIMDEFSSYTSGVVVQHGRRPEAERVGDSGQPGGNSPDGVVGPAASGPDVAPATGADVGAAMPRNRSVKGRPGGDG